MEQENSLPLYMGEASTVTIVGVSNMSETDIMGLSSLQSVTSYSVSADVTSRSRPLSEGAVRVGNSLLNARVSETKFLRDEEEL